MRAALWEIKPKKIQRSKIGLICALPIIIFIIIFIIFFPLYRPRSPLRRRFFFLEQETNTAARPFLPTYTLPIHPTTKTPI
jgi:hypothetical protein